MKWLTLILSTLKEFLVLKNKVPQKEIDAREAEKTDTKQIKSDIKQIRLTKKKMRRFEKWYKWALNNDFIKEGEDKFDAYERYQNTRRNQRK